MEASSTWAATTVVVGATVDSVVEPGTEVSTVVLVDERGLCAPTAAGVMASAMTVATIGPAPRRVHHRICPA